MVGDLEIIGNSGDEFISNNLQLLNPGITCQTTCQYYNSIRHLNTIFNIALDGYGFSNYILEIDNLFSKYYAEEKALSIDLQPNILSSIKKLIEEQPQDDNQTREEQACKANAYEQPKEQADIYDKILLLLSIDQQIQENPNAYNGLLQKALQHPYTSLDKRIYPGDEQEEDSKSDLRKHLFDEKNHQIDKKNYQIKGFAEKVVLQDLNHSFFFRAVDHQMLPMVKKMIELCPEKVPINAFGNLLGGCPIANAFCRADVDMVEALCEHDDLDIYPEPYEKLRMWQSNYHLTLVQLAMHWFTQPEKCFTKIGDNSDVYINIAKTLCSFGANKDLYDDFVKHKMRYYENNMFVNDYALEILEVKDADFIENYLKLPEVEHRDIFDDTCQSEFSLMEAILNFNIADIENNQRGFYYNLALRLIKSDIFDDCYKDSVCLRSILYYCPTKELLDEAIEQRMYLQKKDLKLIFLNMFKQVKFFRDNKSYYVDNKILDYHGKTKKFIEYYDFDYKRNKIDDFHQRVEENCDSFPRDRIAMLSYFALNQHRNLELIRKYSSGMIKDDDCCNGDNRSELIQLCQLYIDAAGGEEKHLKKYFNTKDLYTLCSLSNIISSLEKNYDKFREENKKMFETFSHWFIYGATCEYIDVNCGNSINKDDSKEQILNQINRISAMVSSRLGDDFLNKIREELLEEYVDEEEKCSIICEIFKSRQKSARK